MSITPDILNDPCTSLDELTVQVTPEESGTATIADGGVRLYLDGDPTGGIVVGKTTFAFFPPTFTVEMKTNFPKLMDININNPYPEHSIIFTGTKQIFMVFATSGFYLATDAGFGSPVAVVKCNESAADQIWRLEINTITGTVNLYLDNIFQGTYNAVIDLEYEEVTWGFASYNASPDDPSLIEQEAILKSIKIGTGLGEFASEISIVPKTKYMNVGDSQQLTVYNGTVDVTSSATFTSSNSGVASVTSGGFVRSIATGMTSITATVGELTATALIVIQYAAPQNSQIVSFAARNGVYRSMEYKTKRYKFRPTSLSCIKVIADKYPVEIDVIYPSIKRAQSVSITSSRAQRIKSALVDCCEVVIRGNSQVSAVFLASSMDELPL